MQIFSIPELHPLSTSGLLKSCDNQNISPHISEHLLTDSTTTTKNNKVKSKS